MFERLDISPLNRLRPRPLRDPRFIADVHLGKLARHLRMAGFDVLWANDWDDDFIVARSAGERRTILTRDKGMLRRSDVERGYFVRATESEAQLGEVVRALQLESLLRPFSRCRECNVPLEDVAREAHGVNPGRKYIRIALVAAREECAEAVDRIVTFTQSL